MDSSGLPSLTNYRNLGNSSQISGFDLIWKVEEKVFQGFRAGSSLILKFPAGVGHPHCGSRKELWGRAEFVLSPSGWGFLAYHSGMMKKASGKMGAGSQSLSPCSKACAWGLWSPHALLCSPRPWALPKSLGLAWLFPSKRERSACSSHSLLRL